MKLKTAQKLRAFYEDIEDEEPDISTERLLAMTADRHNLVYGTEFDNGDVAEALTLTVTPSSCALNRERNTNL